MTDEKRKRGPDPERLKIDAPEGWEAVMGALARKPKGERDEKPRGEGAAKDDEQRKKE